MIRQVGTLVQFSTTTRDASNTPVNTPDVTLAVTKPDGTLVNPAPTVDNTGAGGIYTATLTPDQAGLWLYTWTASGTVVTTQSDQFSVVTQQRALVASLEEFKKHLNRTDLTDDAELRTHLVSATDWAESVIGGPLGITTFTHRVEMRSGRFFPKYRPLVSVTSLTPELGAPLDSSTYVVDTDLHMVRMLYDWGWSCGWYTFVYRAGLSVIPERVKLAGLIVAAHLWQTQNGGGGLPIPGDVNGNESVMFSQSLGFAIPNRARDLLQPDRMPRVS